MGVIQCEAAKVRSGGGGEKAGSTRSAVNCEGDGAGAFYFLKRDWTARYGKCGRAFEKESPGLMFLDMESPTLLLRYRLLAPRDSESDIMVFSYLGSRVYVK